MSDNVFGLPPRGELPEDDPFADAPEVEAKVEELTEEPEPDRSDPLAPKAEEEPKEAEEAAEEPVPEPETALDEVEPEPEPEGTPYSGRYSTKYQTIEQMEEAHRNALAMSQQEQQKAKQIEEQNRQLVEYLRMAGEYIEQQQKAVKEVPQTKTATELQAEADKYGVDPETLQVARQIAAEEAAQRVEPIQEQLQKQQEEYQQQQYAAQSAQRAQQEILNFRSLHDDLNEEVEQEMVDVFNEFQLDPLVTDNYEIALEAARNPSLREVLQANPTYIDTDAGMNYARRMAGVHTVTAPASRENELAAARKRATVEGGNAGAPAAPTESATDPAKDPNSWEAVLEVASNDRKKSAFGV